MSSLEEALEKARAGGPGRHHDKALDQGKLPVRDRVERLVDPDSFVEDALLANFEQEGFGADGVVTGTGTVAGRPMALMANDPTVKAGSWGAADGGEDHPRPGAGAEPPAADALPGRLGRGPDHRSGADVPRPPRRRAHLPHRGEAVGRGAAGLRAVRAERGRRRLHPRVLRRGDHARRQRLDVPRVAADGRDGDRRERFAGGDGRRAHAHRRVRLRPLPREVRRGGHRPGASATCPTSRATGRRSRRWLRRPSPPGAGPRFP